MTNKPEEASINEPLTKEKSKTDGEGGYTYVWYEQKDVLSAVNLLKGLVNSGSAVYCKKDITDWIDDCFPAFTLIDGKSTRGTSSENTEEGTQVSALPFNTSSVSNQKEQEEGKNNERD